jgi:hypothetical protein
VSFALFGVILASVCFTKKLTLPLFSRSKAYRTLPLITPSVKVKRDLPIGSYLRFQYDPKAGPPSFEDSMDTNFDGTTVQQVTSHEPSDAAMKHKECYLFCCIV